VIDRERLAALLGRERATFAERHPRSRAAYEAGGASLLGNVPMTWMNKAAGRFPVYLAEARGATVTDLDGHRYVDLCLGDTAAMAGHSPAPTVAAVQRRYAELGGATAMLPTEDAAWVGAELARRFGVPRWSFSLTATDANRWAIRLARLVTGRPKILVFNWCYHGTVDETFITLRDGVAAARAGNLGPPVDPTATTRVIEFNDLGTLEAALSQCDIACVLAEPVMTNIGIVQPEPGFHAALRDLTRRTGTLLIIDETHTICTGPGGYTRAAGLEPDILTIGKPIAGGIPAAAYGFSAEVAAQIQARVKADESDTGGIGGTLAGNALSIAAMRATLEHVLTDASYARTIPLAERFEAGVNAVIAEYDLPWHVNRLGCRAEYWFRPNPPRNGAEAAAAIDGELDRYMHLAALNRGILMTPFHNMALIAPDTMEADIDFHTAVFRESVTQIVG
jgi:glutamate-1-semialdehyde 2,1-aminomutase